MKNTEEDLEDALWKLEDYETSRSQLEKTIVDLKESGKLQSSAEIAEKTKMITILGKRNAQLTENIQNLDSKHRQTIAAVREESKGKYLTMKKTNAELCEQLEAQRQAIVIGTERDREGLETRMMDITSLETRNAEL